MKNISWNQIIESFNDEEWDFSWLNGIEINQVLNFPIKIDDTSYINEVNTHRMEIDPDTLFLVVVKKTQDYDYSLTNSVLKILYNNFKIDGKEFWCNYKYATILSGLCQYAKNNLVYHHKFYFDTHLSVIQLFSPIIDLPVRKLPNFNLLEKCNNCFDCYFSCPVNAIHNQENWMWVDMEKCDNFNHFNNHPFIPSIKENWLKYEAPFLSENIKQKISNFEDAVKYTGKPINCYSSIDNNVYYQFPICRECTSQPKCSKYNGNYPYDKNNVKIVQI